jgi:hypothetical protein
MIVDVKPLRHLENEETLRMKVLVDNGQGKTLSSIEYEEIQREGKNECYPKICE